MIDDGPGLVRSIQDGTLQECSAGGSARAGAENDAETAAEGTDNVHSGVGEALSAMSYVAVFLLLLYCMLDLSQSGFNPFIYFQF